MKLCFPLYFICFAFLNFCSAPNQKQETLFKVKDIKSTGIDFNNKLTETEEYNIINYMYFYNGGGVAVGDINNDGLSDIYFSANMGSNKLYLNKGDFRFEDITNKAGVSSDKGWKTGVSMTDVNGDGLLDIYVCKVGTHFTEKASNELFINNGDNTFSEKSQEWAVDFQGYSTHSAFFDYDKDGDLDMYLLNHSVHSKGTYGTIDFRKKKAADAGDRLYNNTGKFFKDVTNEAGIYSSVLGYGLGVSISDLNNDGWQDIYISNDFHENDYLYYNNQDGTFTEAMDKSVGHTSRFSMGNDAADINNDGLTDIITADMQAEDEVVLKSSEGAESYEIFQFKLSYGYYYQYPRNMLQVNSGVQFPVNSKIRGNRFSEVGQLAGISSTDWSWSTLFCDFDNDGYKDLFISNGIMRRPNNMDYLKYISGSIVQASLNNSSGKSSLPIIEKMPEGKVANYIFRNKGNYKFSNKTKEWGINFPTLSNGAAYTDLDNDGDYDLIINNLNDLPTLLENKSDRVDKNNFIKVRLVGKGGNYIGIGAKIEVRAQGKSFFYEQSLARGFQSSVDPIINIGIGKAAQADEILVTWNSGNQEILRNVKGKSSITLTEKNASKKSIDNLQLEKAMRFDDVSKNYNSLFHHKENKQNDFNREVLLPHTLSTKGPKIAVGDINADHLDDYFVCGANGQPGQLYIQEKGKFKLAQNEVISRDSLYEDVDAEFFDADNDGDLDLLVVSGGYQFEGEHPLLLNRLYLNNGTDKKGNPLYVRSNNLPLLYSNGSCIAVADYDKDGDTDLFVGSGAEPGLYGVANTSHLLINDGKGNFLDGNPQFASGLEKVGMVSDATWADIDSDGYPDLILSGEWMPISVFKNINGKLKDITTQAGLSKTNGLWNCMVSEDIDDDGDIDLLAGNLGLNSIIKASPLEPATLYVKDFDDNGKSEAILSFYKSGISYPFNTKDELSTQMVSLRKQFTSYGAFAGKTTNEVLSAHQRSVAEKKQAYTFATSLFKNDGKGKFTQLPLSLETQLAPVFAIICQDIDGDGIKDIITGGNLNGVGPAQGRYDASMGNFLKGLGRGKFKVIKNMISELYLQDEVRDFKCISTLNGKMILVGVNNGPMKILKYGNN